MRAGRIPPQQDQENVNPLLCQSPAPRPLQLRTRDPSPSLKSALKRASLDASASLPGQSLLSGSRISGAPWDAGAGAGAGPSAASVYDQSPLGPPRKKRVSFAMEDLTQVREFQKDQIKLPESTLPSAGPMEMAESAAEAPQECSLPLSAPSLPVNLAFLQQNSSACQSENALTLVDQALGPWPVEGGLTDDDVASLDDTGRINLGSVTKVLRKPSEGFWSPASASPKVTLSPRQQAKEATSPSRRALFKAQAQDNGAQASPQEAGSGALRRSPRRHGGSPSPVKGRSLLGLNPWPSPRRRSPRLQDKGKGAVEDIQDAQNKENALKTGTEVKRAKPHRRQLASSFVDILQHKSGQEQGGQQVSVASSSNQQLDGPQAASTAGLDSLHTNDQSLSRGLSPPEALNAKALERTVDSSGPDATVGAGGSPPRIDPAGSAPATGCPHPTSSPQPKRSRSPLSPRSSAAENRQAQVKGGNAKLLMKEQSLLQTQTSDKENIVAALFLAEAAAASEMEGLAMPTCTAGVTTLSVEASTKKPDNSGMGTGHELSPQDSGDDTSPLSLAEKHDFTNTTCELGKLLSFALSKSQQKSNGNGHQVSPEAAPGCPGKGAAATPGEAKADVADESEVRLLTFDALTRTPLSAASTQGSLGLDSALSLREERLERESSMSPLKIEDYLQDHLDSAHGGVEVGTQQALVLHSTPSHLAENMEVAPREDTLEEEMMRQQSNPNLLEAATADLEQANESPVAGLYEASRPEAQEPLEGSVQDDAKRAFSGAHATSPTGNSSLSPNAMAWDRPMRMEQLHPSSLPAGGAPEQLVEDGGPGAGEALPMSSNVSDDDLPSPPEGVLAVPNFNTTDSIQGKRMLLMIDSPVEPTGDIRHLVRKAMPDDEQDVSPISGLNVTGVDLPRELLASSHAAQRMPCTGLAPSQTQMPGDFSPVSSIKTRGDGSLESGACQEQDAQAGECQGLRGEGGSLGLERPGARSGPADQSASRSRLLASFESPSLLGGAEWDPSLGSPLVPAFFQGAQEKAALDAQEGKGRSPFARLSGLQWDQSPASPLVAQPATDPGTKGDSTVLLPGKSVSSGSVKAADETQYSSTAVSEAGLMTVLESRSVPDRQAYAGDGGAEDVSLENEGVRALELVPGAGIAHHSGGLQEEATASGSHEEITVHSFAVRQQQQQQQEKQQQQQELQEQHEQQEEEEEGVHAFDAQGVEASCALGGGGTNDTGPGAIDQEQQSSRCVGGPGSGDNVDQRWQALTSQMDEGGMAGNPNLDLFEQGARHAGSPVLGLLDQGEQELEPANVLQLCAVREAALARGISGIDSVSFLELCATVGITYGNHSPRQAVMTPFTPAPSGPWDARAQALHRFCHPIKAALLESRSEMLSRWRGELEQEHAMLEMNHSPFFGLVKAASILSSEFPAEHKALDALCHTAWEAGLKHGERKMKELCMTTAEAAHQHVLTLSAELKAEKERKAAKLTRVKDLLSQLTRLKGALLQKRAEKRPQEAGQRAGEQQPHPGGSKSEKLKQLEQQIAEAEAKLAEKKAQNQLLSRQGHEDRNFSPMPQHTPPFKTETQKALKEMLEDHRDAEDAWADSLLQATQRIAITQGWKVVSSRVQRMSSGQPVLALDVCILLIVNLRLWVDLATKTFRFQLKVDTAEVAQRFSGYNVAGGLEALILGEHLLPSTPEVRTNEPLEQQQPIPCALLSDLLLETRVKTMSSVALLYDMRKALLNRPYVEDISLTVSEKPAGDPAPALTQVSATLRFLITRPRLIRAHATLLLEARTSIGHYSTSILKISASRETSNGSQELQSPNLLLTSQEDFMSSICSQVARQLSSR